VRGEKKVVRSQWHGAWSIGKYRWELAVMKTGDQALTGFLGLDPG
jgi:hypothetical protein